MSGCPNDLRVQLTDIDRAFASLRPPRYAAGKIQFSAIDIPDHGENKLAKDVDGHACLLICTSEQPSGVMAPIRLEHMTVEHGLRALVHTSLRTEEGSFSVIVLKSKDPAIISLFLRLALLIASEMVGKPTPEAVARGLRRLIDIFEALKRPSRETTQGLWSELVVMNRARDPAMFVTAWHNDPFDRYDFSSANWKLEVKSAAGRLRRHHFSLEQLLEQRGFSSWVASLFVEQASGGRSITDLLDSIQGKIASAHLRVRLNEIAFATLGSAWQEGLEASFDYELAVTSLNCFPVGEIPRIDESFPVGVSGVTFWSDISGLKGTPFDTWQNLTTNGS